jgi:hypothetical protein
VLFDETELTKKFQEKFLENQKVTVYGEAYGGKMQGMSATYGKELRFISFEIKIDENWLSVPQAAECTASLGFEFVDWVETPTSMLALNFERDKPSVQAVRNGILEPKPREGIVLRPPFECTLNNGRRVIAKHKNELFSERKAPKELDPDKLAKMNEADKIANEYVTSMRLNHVIDRLISVRDDKEVSIKDTGAIIALMIEDVTREAERPALDEIFDSPVVRKAIGSAAAKLFKKSLEQI